MAKKTRKARRRRNPRGSDNLVTLGLVGAAAGGTYLYNKNNPGKISNFLNGLFKSPSPASLPPVVSTAPGTTDPTYGKVGGLGY